MPAACGHLLVIWWLDESGTFRQACLLLGLNPAAGTEQLTFPAPSCLLQVLTALMGASGAGKTVSRPRCPWLWSWIQVYIAAVLPFLQLLAVVRMLLSVPMRWQHNRPSLVCSLDTCHNSRTLQTLMDVLAGRKTGGVITGDIRVNG